jgi:hypothetical protein
MLGQESGGGGGSIIANVALFMVVEEIKIPAGKESKT